MLESLPVMLIVGTVLGFLTGLGIGGGSLLMLWLTIVLDMSTMDAKGINLLFFVPAAAISCVIRIRRKVLRICPLIPAIIAGCLSAAVCAWIAPQIDTTILKKLFGILLLLTGAREVFYRDKKK